jgi:hypothetical protein
MPEITIQTVTACLWDLRAQCEHQLRALTNAQRVLDDYRDRPADRGYLKHQLQQDVQQVVHTNESVLETVRYCVSVVRGLPASSGEPAQDWASEHKQRPQ